MTRRYPDHPAPPLLDALWFVAGVVQFVRDAARAVARKVIRG